MRTSTTTRKNLAVAPDSANPLAGVTGIAYEIEAEITLGTATEIGFRLRTDDDQHTTVGYDAEAQELFVDRSASGLSDFTQYFAGRTTAPMKTTDGRVTLRVYVDSSSVEAFGADGQAAVTSLIFPHQTPTTWPSMPRVAPHTSSRSRCTGWTAPSAWWTE
ncbi:GH32 C-terminal domain-containing protein [Streptomyces sp. INA 01156]